MSDTVLYIPVCRHRRHLAFPSHCAGESGDRGEEGAKGADEKWASQCGNWLKVRSAGLRARVRAGIGPFRALCTGQSIDFNVTSVIRAAASRIAYHQKPC